MTFYFKFTGLLWKYAKVEAPNIKKARNLVEKYRSDAVNMTDRPLITLKEYHEQKFELINLEDYIQTVYAVGKDYNGADHSFNVIKSNVIGSLITRMSNVPGIKQAQVFELIPGQYTLTVKTSKALVKFLASNTPDIPEESISKQVMKQKNFPLFVYRIKETLKEVKMLK